MGSTFDLTYYSMRERTRHVEHGATTSGVDDEVTVQAKPVDRIRTTS